MNGMRIRGWPHPIKAIDSRLQPCTQHGFVKGEEICSSWDLTSIASMCVSHSCLCNQLGA